MSHNLFSSLYSKGVPFALIDTRERRDHVNGHWFGSTNIPLSTLGGQIKRYVPQLDFPIHLLDWQDVASEAAAKLLRELGYTHIERHNTYEPNEFGNGFVKGEFVWSKAFGEVLAHNCGIPEITPATYKAQYRDALFFDVRPTAEFTQFTIPGSQSLPNSLLLANMDALQDTGKCALLHCAGRTRSIIGASTLKAAGYSGHFVIFKGGTQAWQLDGLEREFNANRVFAKESSNSKPARRFLDTWNIAYTDVDDANIESFVEMHKSHLLFDVSDDAATGQLGFHSILKVSGTNLIQQTDRSIARYHVPSVLFDHGSGSRAAFAAYWLQLMGFDVSVAYVTATFQYLENDQSNCPEPNKPYTLLSIEQLIKHQEASGKIYDFRPSKTFSQAHLVGSEWRNISTVVSNNMIDNEAIALVCSDIEHAATTAQLIEQYGGKIAGLYCWKINDINPEHIHTGSIESSVDESALFAGRHHGNMQDSRDYLAWEEALPENIDQMFNQMWLKQLKAGEY